MLNDLAVEQEDSGLCQPAVTHIPRRGSLSHLSSDIHRTVHVRVHHRFTGLADVQSTLHAVRISNLPATRTRLARVLLVYAVNEDAVFLSLVFKQTSESVELPPVQLLVPRLTPVPRIAVSILILADVAEVADRSLLHAFLDIPFHDVLAEGVEEMVFVPGKFPPGTTRPL